MNQKKIGNDAALLPQVKELLLPDFKLALDQLDAFDGIVSLVEPFAPDIERVVSERNKKRFLEDEYAQEERLILKEQMLALARMLRKAENANELRALAQDELNQNETVFNKNVNTILEAVRPLERSFRELEIYFQNANAAKQKINNLTILPVNQDALLNHESDVVHDKINKLLMNEATNVDQTNAYSMLVIPTLWQAKKPKLLIERYMEMANNAKVCFLTDFEDAASAEEALEWKKSKKWGGEKGLMGSEHKNSKLVMFVNHLKLRKAYTEEYGEQQDLHGSPAMAVAGKMYRTIISQPVAGKQNGEITGIDGFAFEVRLPEVNDFAEVSLNAMMNAYGKNMAYEQCTAFNGEPAELRRYAIVRVYDYVYRVMRHYLGERTHEALTYREMTQLGSTINEFIQELVKERVLESGEVTYCGFDEVQKDKVNIDIRLGPIQAVRTFEYRLQAANHKVVETKK
jgi:Type VI secretion system, TssC, VipB